MPHFDVIIAGESIRSRDSYECLFTGRPCGLVSVTLRKMVLIPPVWVGRKISLELPFSEPPSLALWQYLRMVRWIVTLLVGGVATKAVFTLIGTESLAIYFSLLAVVLVAVWVILGLVLDRYEALRLVSYDKKAGTVTLRFTSPEAARRASEVLAT